MEGTCGWKELGGDRNLVQKSEAGLGCKKELNPVSVHHAKSPIGLTLNSGRTAPHVCRSFAFGGSTSSGKCGIQLAHKIPWRSGFIGI
jgi:hypothetical protein